MSIKDWRAKLHGDYARKSGDYSKEATLYADPVGDGKNTNMITFNRG